MKAVLWLMLGLMMPHLASAQAPSFDCKKVHGRVELMICASPALSAADADLAAVFDNTVHQGGIDATALQREEDAWLIQRDACASSSCVANEYASRKARLLDESLRAASPAAYDETRAFPAPAQVVSAAQAAVGQDCKAVGFGGTPASFSQIQGYLPIITSDGDIFPAARGGVRFAFLLKVDGASCKVGDVVVLPGADVADSFLQCFPVSPNSGVSEVGLGMRKSGVPGNVAYWDIDTQAEKLRREPLGVLSLDKSGLRCQQPESGE